jgi:hypothetical protein
MFPAHPFIQLRGGCILLRTCFPVKPINPCNPYNVCARSRRTSPPIPIARWDRATTAAHGRVGPSGMTATSQGLPRWDLVVASGEVPSRFVHLSTCNLHLSAIVTALKRCAIQSMNHSTKKSALLWGAPASEPTRAIESAYFAFVIPVTKRPKPSRC